MKHSFWKRNGLSLGLVLLFLISFTGQFLTGWASHIEELRSHEMREVSAVEYLQSGHFIESTFENWESEFLQMAVYVLLTASAYQKGSAESNPLPGEPNESEALSKWPRRYFARNRFLRALYENSLSLAFGVLFLLSFGLHLYGGWIEQNLKNRMTASPEGEISLSKFLLSSDFWFQSFQNWQSEFLSVAVLVVLTIFLRQKGSAQSKDVDAPHGQTGP